MKGTIREHIEIVEGFGGPKAVIAGHRIRVEDIVIWHEEMRMSPYEIIFNYPTITLADVYAALAYYWDNRVEMDLAMAEGETFVKEFRRSHPERSEEKQTRRDDAAS
ncbi:MAG: DUF433 domain-containing protein [Chloroflexi bacterium]|nr:DUF433 domain-containing protein [Chloroflexota bacterium]